MNLTAPLRQDRTADAGYPCGQPHRICGSRLHRGTEGRCGTVLFHQFSDHSHQHHYHCDAAALPLINYGDSRENTTASAGCTARLFAAEYDCLPRSVESGVPFRCGSSLVPRCPRLSLAAVYLLVLYPALRLLPVSEPESSEARSAGFRRWCHCFSGNPAFHAGQPHSVWCAHLHRQLYAADDPRGKAHKKDPRISWRDLQFLPVSASSQLR